MAVKDMPISTYGDTNTQPRVLSEVVNMIDPTDTPFIELVGGLDGARSKFKIGMNGTKIEILEDTLDALTLTANAGAVITSTTTSIIVSDASLLRDGMVILIDSEYMVVKSADTSTDTITVYSRSYGGTNNTHATTAAIEIVGMARLEGDDADYSSFNQLTVPYNYTSIFQDGIKVTGTMQVVDTIAIGDAFEYQALKKLPRLLQLVNKGAYHGVRAAGSDTTNRSFGGLNTFITDNTTTANSGKITKTIIDDLSEMIMNDGGNPDVFLCAPGTARDFKDILDNSSFIQMGQENTQFGMQPIRGIVTQYHTMRLVTDRFCPTGVAYMLDTRKIGYYTLRPFAWEDMSKTGDSRKGEVVGEFSFLVANDKAHGKITSIVT
jgi:hypothetical protein